MTAGTYRRMQPMRNFPLIAAMSLAAGSLVAPQVATAQPVPPRPGLTTPGAVPGDYRIGPEDVLDIVVWRTADLARTVPVRPDGKISLPLVNDVQAAGLTPIQLRVVLQRGYEAFVNEPEVAVIVKEIHSFKISIMGKVKNSGRFELKSRATLIDALAMAGGFAEFAKRDHILIKRRDGTTAVFNYDKFAEDAGAGNIDLQPDDIIIVP